MLAVSCSPFLSLSKCHLCPLLTTHQTAANTSSAYMLMHKLSYLGIIANSKLLGEDRPSVAEKKYPNFKKTKVDLFWIDQKVGKGNLNFDCHRRWKGTKSIICSWYEYWKWSSKQRWRRALERSKVYMMKGDIWSATLALHSEEVR